MVHHATINNHASGIVATRVLSGLLTLPSMLIFKWRLKTTLFIRLLDRKVPPWLFQKLLWEPG